MKAAVMQRYGAPEVLELRQLPTPTPKANEVLVRVHATSINDWDWGLLQGTLLINRVFNGLFTPRVQVLGCDIAGRENCCRSSRGRTNLPTWRKLFGSLARATIRGR